MPVRPRRAGEAGFTLVVVLGALLVSALLSVAAFAAVNNDMRESGKDIGRKQASPRPRPGSTDYLFHLNQDNGYWAKCTGVPAPNAVNDAWNGTVPDPRTWRTSRVAGRPLHDRAAAGRTAYTKCPQADNVADTMIDARAATLRIRVTGACRPQGHGLPLVIGAVKREGFLDFLYFTDYETSDPTWYALTPTGVPTRSGDVINWAGPDTYLGCKDRTTGHGRGNLTYNGKYHRRQPRERQSFSDNCSEIQFAPQRRSHRAAAHQRRDPTRAARRPSGATAQDRIEVGRRLARHGLLGQQPQLQGHLDAERAPLGMPADQRLAETIARRVSLLGRTRPRSARRRQHDRDERDDRVSTTLMALPGQRRHLRGRTGPADAATTRSTRYTDAPAGRCGDVS